MFKGSSGSGKTVLTKELLENADKMMLPPPIECIFNYACWQELYEQIHTPFPIKFVEGISKFEDLPKDRQPRILLWYPVKYRKLLLQNNYTQRA